MNKYRVLILAEQADHKQVSVPLVAWSHAIALSKVADVHIVTQIRHRKSFLDYGLREGVDFTAIDTENIAAPLHKLSKILRGGSNKGWTTAMAISIPAYYYFEFKVWKKFKSQLRNNDFDIVHRISPLSPTKPSIIAKKCKKINIPFIWGPIAGGLPWPEGYNKERNKEKEWLSYLRSAYKLLPGYKSSRENATALIIASIATWKQVPEKYHNKCVYIPENAIDPERFNINYNNKSDDTLKLVFIGRLVPYKCPDIAIEASRKLLENGDATMDIIGDGPEMDKLVNLVSSYNLADKVKFHSNIPHKQVQEIMRNCDILVFPSIREFGGGVVLEAMALGVVPIVVNYGGPPELLTSKNGIKVDISDKKALINKFANEIEKLNSNRALLTNMAENATSHISNNFTWDAKAQMTLKVYDWVTNKSEKPFFGMPIK